MKRVPLFVPVLLAAALLGPASRLAAQNAVPQFIDYQGRLTDVNGNPLGGANGANFTVEFRIYDAESGDSEPIWGEQQTFTVVNGEFSVRLGEGIAISGVQPSPLLSAFNGSSRYLGVTVVGLGGEISPRLAFLSAPYAVKAQTAAVADSLNQTVGDSLAANLTVTGSATLANPTLAGNPKISGATALEFGAGVIGKEPSAGKIGYATFTPNTLDIVGAGQNTNPVSRQVKIWAEGGLTVQGPLTATGAITGGSLNTTGALTGGSINSGAYNVTGTGAIQFSSNTRQMINLWSNNYGIGVQANTQYFRTASQFAWFHGGIHNDTSLAPGTGGRRVMYLENSGILRIKQDSNYGNALAQAGGRVTFGDANYVYVGESATEDDVLELKGAQGIVINAPGDMPSPFGQGAPWKISHVNLTTPVSLHALVFQPTALSNVRVFLNSTGGLSASSDRALKTDVETLAPTLDRVAKLRPVSYRYKTDDGQPGPSALGFIAQEVEEQFPALVIGEEGSKILNYSELVPITIAALQEEHGQRRDADTAQAREIQALQRENAALQQRLEALEQRLGVK